MVEHPSRGSRRRSICPASTITLRITVDECRGRDRRRAGNDGRGRRTPVWTPSACSQIASEGPVELLVVLRRGRIARRACALVDGHYPCDDVWVTTNEGRDGARPRAAPPEAGVVWSALTVSTVRDGGRSPLLHDTASRVHVEASSSLSRDLKAVRGQRWTLTTRRRGWPMSSTDPPTFELTWDGYDHPGRDSRWLQGAAASTPMSWSFDRARSCVEFDSGEDGRATFKPMRGSGADHHASELNRHTLEAGKDVLLPVGITQVSLPGSSAPGRRPRAHLHSVAGVVLLCPSAQMTSTA